MLGSLATGIKTGGAGPSLPVMKKSSNLSLFAAVAMAGPAPLLAQATWIGADAANWNDPANWNVVSPDPGPASDGSAALVFDSPTNRTSVNGLGNFTATSITVNATSRDNTLNGNGIKLGGNFTVSTGNWQWVNLAIELTGDRTFAINSGRTYLSGELSGASGKITKTGAGELYLSGTNSLGAAERLLINSSSTVHLESSAALGAAGGSIRFGNGVAAGLAIRSDSAIHNYNLGGGSSSTGGTVTLNRATGGAGYSQGFAVVDVGSRTMTFNQGANVSSGQMTAAIGELRMTAGNNDRPVTLAGSAAITVGTASIPANALLKRLQLDGTNANNSIGAISNGIAGATVALIKSNSSTWTLSAANSYSGSTEVSGGTLVAQQPSLADVAAVSVASGAVLELAHGAIDTIGDLSLAGVRQPDGLYDATNSGGGLGGTGKLRVVTTHIGADASLWSSAGNWSGLNVPLANGTHDLTFLSAANRSSTNDLVGLRASSITFAAGGRDNNLNGSEVLTLAGNVTVATGNWQWINMPMAISGDRVFAVNAGRLHLSGPLSGSATDSITKTGAGELHVTGTSNSFAGGITVTTGKLLLAAPFLSDSATVSVNGVLELSHGLQDRVGKLFLNGVQQEAGIYDSFNSGGRIIGGSLEVMVGPDSDPFATWAAAEITALQPSADASASGDADGDGTPNLAEFAFRGDPLDGADNGIVTRFVTDSSDAGSARELVLTLAIRRGNPATFAGSPLQLQAGGVTYTVEGSTDLAGFGAAVSEVDPVTAGLPDLSADPDYEYRSFRLDASDGLTGKGFLRARVEP